MFKLSRKSLIVRSLLVCVGLVAVLSIGFHFIHKIFQANAITGDGDTVVVTDDGQVPYDGDNHTGLYKVTINGQKYEAFCAQPSLEHPVGTTYAVRMNDSNSNNLMKFVIFLYQQKESNIPASVTNVRNAVFGAFNSDELFQWTHAIIGVIYYNDYTNLSNAAVENIDNAITTLQNNINNNSDAWIMAKNYQLFKAPGYGSGIQDVVWIENSYQYGAINIQKCDSATNNCSPQGNANFSGIKFEVYNNSGSKIYNDNTKQFYANGALVATGTTDTNGAVSFTNLLANNVNYIVKETATNQSYELTAGQQTVTLNGDKSSKTLKFYNTPVPGKIVVNKIDSDTDTCTTVGNASFNGTTFQLRNNSENAILYNGTSYAKGAVIDTKQLTNDGCSVTFEGLPYGAYKVEEITVGTGYNLNTTAKDVVIPTDGSTSVSVTFENTPIYGDITVNKVDADSKQCIPYGNLSFDGTTFQLTNDSNNAIYYNGVKKDKGDVIDSKTLANGDCSVTFSNLPYGKYILKETAVGKGYVLNNTTWNPTIPENGSSNLNINITAENRIIRGDVKFVKMDGTNEKPMANTVFDISSVDEDRRVIETHYLVSNQDGVVDTSSSFALHSFHTNGYDDLYFEPEPVTFLGYGTWFGLDHEGNSLPVQDNLGALPYGTYIIQELKCNANFFCSGYKDAKSTITIDTDGQVINLANWDNTCAKFSLETEAVDAADDDKFLEIGANTKATIKDKVSYCVKPGVKFTLKGVLMDKETGKELLINNEPVEKSIELLSEDECGEIEMDFEADISELGGKELVVFEYLYYQDDLIISHEDINDASQTVEVISLYTYATNDKTGEKTLPHDEDVKIKDVVKYCLKPGVEYTIKGILMNKTTGEPLLIDEKTVEQEVAFTPKERCGEFEMFYELNTTDLAGTKLVIFESLYRDDELILEHKNIDNADESVDVLEPTPAPETGMITNSNKGIQQGNPVVFVVIATTFVVVGAIGTRVIARRRIFR